MLNYNINSKEISVRVKQSFSHLKIILKVKNQSKHVQAWIDHHLPIVGEENLIIADNMSHDDGIIFQIYKKYPNILIFQFYGPHNSIHQTSKFEEIFDAIKTSCNFYIILDADERLIWTDGLIWLSDKKLLEKLKINENELIKPCGWIENFPLQDSKFYYDESPDLNLWIRNYGKPIYSSRKNNSSETIIHNCQAGLSSLDLIKPMNFFILHLFRLFPNERLISNKNKLLIRGLINDEYSFEDIIRMDRKNLPDDGVSLRCVNEIEEIYAYLAGDTSLEWGPTDFTKSISFIPNGSLMYGSNFLSQNFQDLINGNRPLSFTL